MCVNKCSDNYFKFDNTHCKICDSNCKTCEISATNCLSCKDATYLKGTVCVAECGDRLYENILNNKCSDCQETC